MGGIGGQSAVMEGRVAVAGPFQHLNAKQHAMAADLSRTVMGTDSTHFTEEAS